MNDEYCRRLALLQMKQIVGTLTDEEARELRRTPILIRGEGGGALVEKDIVNFLHSRKDVQDLNKDVKEIYWKNYEKKATKIKMKKG